MSDNCIQYIDLICSKDKLIEQIEDCNDSSEYKLEEKKTKQGKTLLCYEDLTKSGADILAEYNSKSQKVHFKNFKLGKRDFYNDLSYQINYTLRTLALDRKGTYISTCDSFDSYIVKGNSLSCKQVLVQEDSNIPYTGIDTDIEQNNDSSLNLGSSYKINKPIKVFIKSNPDIKSTIKGLSLTEAMNVIGKLLIKKRVVDELSSEDFIDYFRQVGAIGVTDPTLIKIYTLIKP